MEKFVFLLKTYQNDLQYAVRLIQSFHHFNCDNIKMFIVMPEKLFGELRTRVNCNNITFMTEEACPYLVNKSINGIAPGYINQEIIKLSFWENNLCENYFCLDSDGIFIRQFGYDDFLCQDGYPYTVLFEDCDLKADPDYYEKFWQLREKSLEKIKNELNFYNNRTITCHGFQIFNYQVLKHMKKHFMDVNMYTYESLMTISPYEFSWYNFYLQKSNVIPIHICGEMFKCFHTPKQYVLSLLGGLKLDDLRRSYVGIILNSNYTKGKDINFGDISKFHINITLKQYLYVTREFFYSFLKSIKNSK